MIKWTKTTFSVFVWVFFLTILNLCSDGNSFDVCCVFSHVCRIIYREIFFTVFREFFSGCCLIYENNCNWLCESVYWVGVVDGTSIIFNARVWMNLCYALSMIQMLYIFCVSSFWMYMRFTLLEFDSRNIAYTRFECDDFELNLSDLVQ